MNLRDCYIKLGGDFDDVLGRFRKEQMVEKFMNKFLNDKSFELYESAMSKEDYNEALRAVHTLKGICQNLSFTKLYEISNQITKALKENDYSTATELSPQLSKDYHQVINAVEEYNNTMER